MIKFRTKKLAMDWWRFIYHELNIHCKYDGGFNLIGFESEKWEKEALKQMKKYKAKKVLKMELRSALRNPQQYYENNFDSAYGSWALHFENESEMVIEALKEVN